MTQQNFAETIRLVLGTLLVLVTVSALAVVYNSFLHRQIFIELKETDRVRNALDVEYGKLLLERGTWASPAFVEQLAVERLHMGLPEPGQIVVVAYDRAHPSHYYAKNRGHE